MHELDLEKFHDFVAGLWGAKKYKDDEDKNKQDKLILEALKPYEYNEIMLVLMDYYKFQSDKTKPTLSKLVKELEKAKTPENSQNEHKGCFYGDTEQTPWVVWLHQYRADRTYLQHHKNRAIDDLFKDMYHELPFNLRKEAQNFGGKLEMAYNNGWLDKIDEYLAKYPKMPSTGGKSFNVNRAIQETAQSMRKPIIGIDHDLEF